MCTVIIIFIITNHSSSNKIMFIQTLFTFTFTYRGLFTISVDRVSHLADVSQLVECLHLAVPQLVIVNS